MAEYTNLDPTKEVAGDETFPVKEMPQVWRKISADIDEEEPSTIVEYLDRLDALMAGLVKSDKVKKRYMVEYVASFRIRDMWRALPLWKNGTYEVFRRNVLSPYPEAADLIRGSLECLQRYFQSNTHIAADDLGRVMRLSRTVSAEAEKLLKNDSKGTRALVTNVQLCQWIFGCLDRNFASQVRFRLSVTPKATTAGGEEGGDATAHDDIDFNPFKWEDVLQTAVDMARQNHGQSMPVVMGDREYDSYREANVYRPPGAAKPLREIKLEENGTLSRVPEFGNELAQIKDLITSQAKQSSVFQDQLATQLRKLEADQAETRALVREINQYQHTGGRAPPAPVLLKPRR
jgi:hypothetical protein